VQQAKDRSKYQQQKLSATRSAAAEFADKGFHGASTAGIARRMGIKQGSLYYYFRSKGEALFEVCMFGIRDYVRRMEDIAGSKQPFEAKLLATIGAHLSGYREKNEALKVYNTERLYLSSAQRKDLKRQGSRYRQLLEGIFEQGVREGVVRGSVDCHFAALAVIGLCNSWGELIVRDHDLDVFTVVQKCTDMLLNGFSETATGHTD
jgi:AcrR family transcriptional regulator